MQASQEQNQGWSNKSKGQFLGSMPRMENPARGRTARCPQGTQHSLSSDITSPCQLGSRTISPKGSSQRCKARMELQHGCGL